MTQPRLRARRPPFPGQFPPGLALALILGACSLNLASADLQDCLRSTVRDFLAPGQRLLQCAVESAKQQIAAVDREEDATSASLGAGQREALALRIRQLELELNATRDRLADAQRHGRRARGTASPPLLVPELIEARWLGEESAGLWRSRAVVAAGSSAGLFESALVLQSQLPLVDAGTDLNLTIGDAVYAGRIVVGKIAEVGRFSSTVRLVTDPEFSGRARVARRTDRGLEVIAEGTLVGDGTPTCRLKHVTEPVAAGDEVFTGGTDGVIPYPMYYGTVVDAELPPAAREWTIQVRPAAATDRRETVEILRLSLNRERILGN